MMAEFQEVLHQWRRLCDKYDSCNECPGAKTSDKESICMLMSYDNRRTEAEVEDIIMSWAAEHPEPVYPTWKEWLEEQRVVVHFDSVNEKGKKVKWELTNKSNCPIPADMAEKLEIKPKEV